VGLEIIRSSFVVDDLIKLISVLKGSSPKISPTCGPGASFPSSAPGAERQQAKSKIWARAVRQIFRRIEGIIDFGV
jgi:hypothetical protein